MFGCVAALGEHVHIVSTPPTPSNCVPINSSFYSLSLSNNGSSLMSLSGCTVSRNIIQIESSTNSCT